jgi:hypothetical protein
MPSAKSDSPLIQCGREINPEELCHLKEVVELFPRLSRDELAHTLCEHLGWVTASGGHKMSACMKLLEKIEAKGMIRLPQKRFSIKVKQAPVSRTGRTDPPAEQIMGELADIRPVRLVIARSKEAAGLWNEYVDRHHYLGYKKPFGFPLRYFVECEQGTVGCVLLAGAAKAIGVRDRWIGWSDNQRLRNLAWVVNNTRFLLFPWVRVRHLASHVLGLVVRQVREDWMQRWGYRPLLLETFVDPQRYQGTSYRAAGWTCLGRTTGEGLRRPGREYRTHPKMIFVRPLVGDFRKQLCSQYLVGKEEEE